MKYANLHLHSIFSDGNFTPYQLVLIAKSLGYKALALTDHATHGGVRDLLAAAEKESMGAVSGIEFVGNAFGMSFHITGLDFDMDDHKMNALVRRECENYIEFTRFCVDRALRLGLIQGITWNDVLDYCEEGMWICVDQVWHLLKKKKLISRAGDSMELRSQIFAAPEAIAARRCDPTAEEVIATIRGAGGVAVLAHPYNATRFVGKLVELGLNGIEVSHPDLDTNDEWKLALEAAEAYRLYRSGGTDHTGALSGCGGKYAVEALHGIGEEEYFTLKQRRLG